MEYIFEKPVKGFIGTEKYRCTIEWRNGKFIADEKESSGGKDMGPDPFTLLLSSITSCALITMRMYIDRKGWDIPQIAVSANIYKEMDVEKDSTIIDLEIKFISAVDDQQKLRLQEIVKHCPLSRVLEGNIKVRTFLFKNEDVKRKVNYSNDDITVVWKPEFCEYSTICYSQLPEVFNPKIKKWIDPKGASSERIIEQVKKCPTGALSFFYNDENKNNLVNENLLENKF
jgi:putative redox protein